MAIHQFTMASGRAWRIFNNLYSTQYFSILTIGGNDQKESEKFDVNEGPENSLFTSPNLYYYYDYPELFVVPQDFCQ